MSKYIYALISVIIIEFALYLFAGATYSNTTLLSLILNPSASSTFWTTALTVLTAIAAVAVVATAFFQINTFGVYAGVAGATFTFGYTIFNLWRYITGTLSGLGFTSSTQLAAFVIAPLLIFYIVATLEWARSNS